MRVPHHPIASLAMQEAYLWDALANRAGVEPSSLAELVEAIRLIPYGRPADRSPAGIVAEWRGTCSTKHALLVKLVSARWPELEPRIVHRVYRLTPEIARRLFGERASAVPERGVVDVHTYVTVRISDDRVAIDATVPGPPWDGRSSMSLACRDGLDIEGGNDPWSTKARLVEQHCDMEVRERVIKALSD